MADKVSKFIFPVKSGNTIANKEFELPRGSSFDGDYNSLTNKPTLGTAAAKDVPSSGNASSSQVVMGNDSRLSDSRNAKDVPAWAKASSKPTYTASEVGAIATSAKGVANGVAELDSTGKVPSSQLPSHNHDDRYYTETEVDTKLSKTEVLIINVASFSSLPQTVSDENIESDMVVVNSILGTPSAQIRDWTVTTSNGSLTISGASAINGSTTLTLYLMKSR